MAAGRTVRKSSRAAEEVRIPVEFDRTIVRIIGDEHYPDASALFTELSANAYDADATEVHFAYKFHDEGGLSGGYQFVAEDNGNGMDLAGLRDYFRFGSPRKRQLGTTPRFKREMLGQFGLGKVSALKAADQWFLETEHEGVRYFVDVNFGEWMLQRDGADDGFVVERRTPKGKNGTRIELVGVHLSGFRDDKIVRAVRKLPLGNKFKVYLNGRLVSPRVWDDVPHWPINEDIEYKDDRGKVRTGKVTGGVYISKTSLRLEEGTKTAKSKMRKTDLNLDEALADDPRGRFAGIEVHVRGATVAREFFGRETHAHGLNFLWGYVNADWLPVVANRTDYVHDSPEGSAFSKRMEEVFGKIYIEWRKQRDAARAKERAEREAREAREAAAGDGATPDDGIVSYKDLMAEEGESRRDDGGTVETASDRVLTRAKSVVEDVSVRLQRYFEREPDQLPFLGEAPPPRKGRPFEKLIKPLLEMHAIEDSKGDLVQTDEYDFSITRREFDGAFLEPKARRRARGRTLKQVDAKAAKLPGVRTVVQPVGHGALKVVVSGSDLPTDDAYRWATEPKGLPQLVINANHPLHLTFSERVGPQYEAYIGMLVALAFAEKRWNVVHRQGIVDYVLDLATEATRIPD